VHPLDVLCVLLHCSDHFLQQEIVSKMSMCQFAVPLLLPAGDSSYCTFMLWAMRDIVKSWRPQSLAESKGFIEDNVVDISMPTFSFVRFGKIKLSKSKTMNKVLSPTQQSHEFFIHENMEGGNHQRIISDGLVEISWYFPAGREKSDTFPEPIAVTNLRGDLESNWTQFSFLTQVSSAIFVFAESINEREYNLLSNCSNSNTKFYFIITPSGSKCAGKETKDLLKKLFPELKIDRRNVLFKDKIGNDAELVKKIQYIITDVLKNPLKRVKLVDMSNMAPELGIKVDENNEQCQKAKASATGITRDIGDVVQYKRVNMKLQGDLWKELAQTEKELCRMKKQGHKNVEEYRSQLMKRRLALHREQNQHVLPDGMSKFISAITNLSQVEKHYFLKWMKFTLDSIARNNLSELQSEYKEKCNNDLSNLSELKQIDQKISDSSLGVEHFLREMGQFYEAECSLVRERQIHPNQRQFSELPGIAANLLLDGFPLELIDGDASNIPLQWVTDVLTELDTKTGGRCRMRVITVLGVQSTGKSTLLNTMFGLQFSVASGRCTRGAFMTLIKVKDDFQEELGCQFILVIDTEGLKAPELASLEDSYEHDNELATLVVGLSDITISNMAMESSADMKDTLQIVAHAFLRMKEIGKKPNCQFVHQNVSDVTAHENNMRDRTKLLDQLNEMTKVAAKMEKKIGITAFSDIMEYDLEKDNWYIPGLWYGVPPMASVNSGYSEHVYTLKKYLFEVIKNHLGIQHPQDVCSFIVWLKSLWNAVKHEKFIFSFKNSLVAEAYDKLCIRYSEWEWDFRKQIHSWLIKTQNTIKNLSEDNLQLKTLESFRQEAHEMLGKEEVNMIHLVEEYFESKAENVHLIVKYREEFSRSVNCLRKELENMIFTKFEEAIRIKKGKYQIQGIQNTYQNTIEENVSRLLRRCLKKKRVLSDREVEDEFEKMWRRTLEELPKSQLKKRNIGHEMLQLLKRDMANKGSLINEKLLSAKCLADYAKNDFQMDQKYIDIIWNPMKLIQEYFTQTCHKQIQDLAIKLIGRCNDYVAGKINEREDYDETYCQELINIVNKRLTDDDVGKLPIAPIFELDLKIYILGTAAPKFEKMHKKYLKDNDPKRTLENLKPHYLTSFQNIFKKMDEPRSRAKRFCELCLKPAITEHINTHLGQDIVYDVLHSSDSKAYSSRKHFQFTVLKKLLEENNFKQYLNYINYYERFVKTWIIKDISEKYEKSKGLETLQLNILTGICQKIRQVLQDPRSLECATVSVFLKTICDMLKNELVISQNGLKVIIFQNKADIQQFSSDIQLFLTEMEKQMTLEIKSSSTESILDKVSLKPQDELFKNVCGCGRQCPFCKVPCEAGATNHKEHFASVHRPKGLARCTWKTSGTLTISTCSTDVLSTNLFVSPETEGEFHFYKDYQKIYPDWLIEPAQVHDSLDYWKFVFKKFNRQFADAYVAEAAWLPDDWKSITEEDALKNLQETFFMT
ncbi:interferon-induced very large GTPase 1-like, partial [Rhinophrynus dorsalis]